MRYFIAIVLSFLLAGPALAYHCPTLIHEIDEKLASHDYDSTTREQVTTLRNEGETLHRQGKHDESIKVLEEALDKLKSADE